MIVFRATMVVNNPGLTTKENLSTIMQTFYADVKTQELTNTKPTKVTQPPPPPPTPTTNPPATTTAKGSSMMTTPLLTVITAVLLACLVFN